MRSEWERPTDVFGVTEKNGDSDSSTNGTGDFVSSSSPRGRLDASRADVPQDQLDLPKYTRSHSLTNGHPATGLSMEDHSQRPSPAPSTAEVPISVGRLMENIDSLASPQDVVSGIVLFPNILTDLSSADTTFATKWRMHTSKEIREFRGP